MVASISIIPLVTALLLLTSGLSVPVEAAKGRRPSNSLSPIQQLAAFSTLTTVHGENLVDQKGIEEEIEEVIEVHAEGSTFSVDIHFDKNRHIDGLNESYRDVALGSYNVLKQVSAHSWEWGTQTQVALELFYPQLSVFSSKCPFPLPCGPGFSSHHPKYHGKQPTELYDIIDPILVQHPNDSRPQPIVDGEGASGDPASLGTALLVAANTAPHNRSNFYLIPAREQLEYLLEDVPRNEENGISQREAQVQFWSDYGYMGPPFIAYYGALTSNLSLIELAHQQYKAYRDVLMVNESVTNWSGYGLWAHILLGNETDGGGHDEGYWSTGEAWVASGMLRVLATLTHIPPPLRLKTIALRHDLHRWTREILDAVWVQQNLTSGLLPNYYRSTEQNAYFECSGTAMLAATTFRLAQLTGDRTHLRSALYAMQSILENNIDPKTFILSPVVGPLGQWSDPQPLNSTSASPEGQAFVVAMLSAWRDFKKGPTGWALF